MADDDAVDVEALLRELSSDDDDSQDGGGYGDDGIDHSDMIERILEESSDDDR